ncbi:unnamed protein product, partial [Rotaria socialis]
CAGTVDLAHDDDVDWIEMILKLRLYFM